MGFMPTKASFFPAMRGCPVMRDYLAIVRAITGTDEGQNIFSFGEADLLCSKAAIVPLWSDGAEGPQMVGGFHFCMGEDRIAHIKGVVADRKHRGGSRMRELLIDTMDTLRHLKAVAAFTLEIRIYPDGSLNERALRRFLSVGFVPENVARIKIQGTDLDRHLLKTAEEGGSVRCLRMRCGGQSMPWPTSEIVGEGEE